MGDSPLAAFFVVCAAIVSAQELRRHSVVYPEPTGAGVYNRCGTGTHARKRTQPWGTDS
jgi:hypothetical protein